MEYTRVESPLERRDRLLRERHENELLNCRCEIKLIPPRELHNHFAIRNVIFNDPATIVFWTDGTKTVVKCQEGDWFDPEKGLAMAISKKAFGNKGAFNNTFKKWIPQCEEIEEPEALNFNLTLPNLGQAVENLNKLSEAVKKKMRY